MIQYLPLLEEEAPGGHRVEMSKKSGHDDDNTNGNGSGDDENPENEKTDLYLNPSVGYTSLLAPAHRFYIKPVSYRHPVGSIQTPPPEA